MGISTSDVKYRDIDLTDEDKNQIDIEIDKYENWMAKNLGINKGYLENKKVFFKSMVIGKGTNNALHGLYRVMEQNIFSDAYFKLLDKTSGNIEKTFNGSKNLAVAIQHFDEYFGLLTKKYHSIQIDKFLGLDPEYIEKNIITALNLEDSKYNLETNFFELDELKRANNKRICNSNLDKTLKDLTKSIDENKIKKDELSKVQKEKILNGLKPTYERFRKSIEDRPANYKILHRIPYLVEKNELIDFKNKIANTLGFDKKLVDKILSSKTTVGKNAISEEFIKVGIKDTVLKAYNDDATKIEQDLVDDKEN